MKRFSETDKWRDPWFQGLPHGSKLLFLYLIDNCNNAGFYEENVRETCFQLGIGEVQYQGALKGLERGIKGASGWFWIRRFLRHQKNEVLNPVNPAHRQIIRLIGEQVSRFSEFSEFKEFIAPLKGLVSPIGIGKGIGTGKKGKRVREKPSSDLSARLSGIFRRNGSTPWSDKEVAALSKITFNDEEICMLERYYGSERNKPESICRKDLQTLLNNYAGEVDRARSWCERNPVKSRTVRFEPPVIKDNRTPEEIEEARKSVANQMSNLRKQFKMPA